MPSLKGATWAVMYLVLHPDLRNRDPPIFPRLGDVTIWRKTHHRLQYQGLIFPGSRESIVVFVADWKNSIFPVIFCNADKACRFFAADEKNQQSSCAATDADGGNPLQNGHRSSIPHVYGCCRSEPTMQPAKNTSENYHRPWLLSYRHHTDRRSTTANTHSAIAGGKNTSSPPSRKTHRSSHWHPDQARKHSDINDDSVQAMDLKFNNGRGKRYLDSIRILASDSARHELEDVTETHLVEFANRSMIHVNST
ncbi:hypothetical protein ACLOJK_035360 [Asimina triloba]